MFEYFKKICRHTSRCIKIWQEQRVIYKKAYLRTFMIITRWILLRMRNVSDKIYRETQNTHFTFKTFSRKSYRLWDNMEKYGNSQTGHGWQYNTAHALWCWITKATDPLGVCNTYCFSVPIRERASLLGFKAHCLSCYKNIRTNICLWTKNFVFATQLSSNVGISF
jgi:hypothetical protein